MNRETVSHTMPSGQSVSTYLRSSVTDHPETPDLGGHAKNVGVSGQDGFILNSSGGEEICSVAVPYARAIVQGGGRWSPPRP